MDNDRWGGDDYFVVLFFTAPIWVPALVLIMVGLAKLGARLTVALAPVAQFVAAHILPHWFDYLLWLAIIAGCIRLAVVLKEELTPLIRRMRIWRHWRRLDAEEQRRYLAARQELDEAFRTVMKKVKIIQKRAQ